MVSRQNPVIDYVPHCVKRAIIHEESMRMSEGYTVNVTQLMRKHLINEAAAKSILNKIMEEVGNE